MAIKSQEEYEKRKKLLKQNAERRDWERKNAGKSYARLKREERDRKFRGWFLGGIAGIAGWILLFTINVTFAIIVGVIVGGVTGIVAGTRNK